MIHDDMVWSRGPFANPAWYRTYVFPNLKKFIIPLREQGKVVLFTSDGNYTDFIKDLADCGVSGFVLEPLTDLDLLVREYGQTHVIIGNADTRLLLTGKREEIRREVERCLHLGRDCPGYFLAVGNHIPPNTPTDNVLYYNEVYEELCWRW
jgi:uroporphyrinogen-III decarboxylase